MPLLNFSFSYYCAFSWIDKCLLSVACRLWRGYNDGLKRREQIRVRTSV